MPTRRWAPSDGEVGGWHVRRGGFAVVCALLFVAQLVLTPVGLATTLTGKWNVVVSLSADPVDLEMEFTSGISLRSSGFSTSLDLKVVEAGIKTLDVKADGSVGSFALGAAMKFSGTPTAFDGATLTLSTSTQGVRIANETQLTGTPSGARSTWSFDGHLSWASWSASVEASLCPARLTGIEIEFGGVGFGCVQDVDLSLEFVSTGFKSFVVDVPRFEIPLPWLPTVAATLTFTPTGKDLAVRCALGSVKSDSCIEVSLGPPAGAGSTYVGPGTVLKSLKIECVFDGVKVRYTHTPVWDALEFSGKATECGTLTWDVRVYSKPSAAGLFSVESVTCSMRYQPCPALYMGLKVICNTVGSTAAEVSIGGSW